MMNLKKNVSSRDIEDKNPFMDDDDDRSPGVELASRTIEKLRQQYRGMSDDIMDDFSVEMIKHFLDNYEAQAAAKSILCKKKDYNMNWKDIKNLIKKELNESNNLKEAEVTAGSTKFNLRTGVNKNPTKLGIKIQFEPKGGMLHQM